MPPKFSRSPCLLNSHNMKPYYEHGGITIYHGDCGEVLPNLPRSELCLTDPPYGLNIASAGKIGASNGKSSARDYGSSDWDILPLSSQQWALIKQYSDNQIVFGFNNFIDSGFTSTRCVLVWDKKCQNGWRDNFSDCELAWTSLREPPRVFRYLWMGACRGAELDAKYHPTQKPVALMAWCLSLCPTANTVIDPFMGSGTTLVASKDSGRLAIGIEREEKYCEIAAKRLSQEVFQFS